MAHVAPLLSPLCVTRPEIASGRNFPAVCENVDMNPLLLLLVSVISQASVKADAPNPLPKGEGTSLSVSFLDDRLIVTPGKGVTARTADGAFAITLRARAQVRETFSYDTTATNELNVKTLR